MIGFVGFDPAVFPIIDRAGRLARIKNQERFRELMMDVVDRAHRMANSGPASLEGAKRIGQLVCNLQEALDDNPGVSQHLGSSDVEAVSNLAETLQRLERLKKDRRPGKWKETIRKQFVSGLLDAVEAAGGRLGLDRPNGRGTLVEAIKLLRLCLPNDEFRRGLSIPTLKKIKTERAKKSQKMI
jgi:hypothetical protein